MQSTKRSVFLLCILLSFSVSAVAACRHTAHPCAPDDMSRASPADVTSLGILKCVVTAQPEGPIAVELSVSDTTTSRGDSLLIVPALVNTTSDSIDIMHPRPPELVYAYFEGKQIHLKDELDREPIGILRTLSPGERYSYWASTFDESDWNRRHLTLTFDQEGEYHFTAHAWFSVVELDTNGIETVRVSYRIWSDPVKVVVK